MVLDTLDLVAEAESLVDFIQRVRSIAVRKGREVIGLSPCLVPVMLGGILGAAVGGICWDWSSGGDLEWHEDAILPSPYAWEQLEFE